MIQPTTPAGTLVWFRCTPDHILPAVLLGFSDLYEPTYCRVEVHSNYIGKFEVLRPIEELTAMTEEEIAMCTLAGKVLP